MMDRARPNLERSQVFFIEMIVQPLFDELQKVIPTLNGACDQLRSNKQYWKDVVAAMTAADELKKKQQEEADGK
jgi:hypothetical protein